MANKRSSSPTFTRRTSAILILSSVSKGSILYLAVTDVAASTAELEKRGVEIVSPPHRITEQPTYDLWMSFFKEPDGRLLALSMEAPKGWKPA